MSLDLRQLLEDPEHVLHHDRLIKAWPELMPPEEFEPGCDRCEPGDSAADRSIALSVMGKGFRAG
jgi:hypothetical protein